MSFPKMRLDQVCLIRRGSTITKNQVKAGNIPVVAGGKTSTISHNEANRDAYTITVSASGASAGFVNFWQVPIFASDCSTVEVINELADINYVYYFLKFKQDYLYSLQAGAAQPHVYAKDIAKIEIPLPPLPEQRRIAAILDQADVLRQKRQQAIEKLDQLLQATFIDMFGDPVSNPKGWDFGCIGDMLESVKYGSSDKATLDGEIPILRMNNLTYSGEMDLRDLKYITKAQADEKYLVKEGDILFNRTNSKELVGKTAVYVGPEPMAYAGYLVRGRTKESFAPEYISAFLNSPWGKEKLQSMCKSIVGMANINAKEFQSIVLPIPPENEQMYFKTRVLAIREKKQLLVNQLNVFETLFKSLQNQAFSGTL